MSRGHLLVLEFIEPKNLSSE